MGPPRRPVSGPVFDLDAIGTALGGLSAEWAKGHPFAAGPSGSPEEVAERMLEGYAYVDGLIAGGLDPFVYGGSRLLLEINHQVLCGASPARRAEFARHLAATERRFYDDPQSGADAFYGWVSRSRHLGPVAFAARAYRQIVETPQLFVEGNQRTAMLVASFVLGRAGLPPLVPTVETFAALSVLSAACKALDRRWLLSMAWGWLLDLQLQGFISRTADPAFLIARADAVKSAPAPRQWGLRRTPATPSRRARQRRAH